MPHCTCRLSGLLALLVLPHCAAAQPAAPKVKPIWESALLGRLSPTDDPFADAREWLRDALVKHKDRPLVPGFVPCVADRFVICRSHGGLVAFTLEGYKAADRVRPGGTVVWRTSNDDATLAVGLGNRRLRPAFTLALEDYAADDREALVLEYAAGGPLVVGTKDVHAIQAFGLPPTQPWLRWQLDPRRRTTDEMTQLVTASSLNTFAIRSGKQLWDRRAAKDDPDFGSSFFLGPPLPLGGRLAVLTESHAGELSINVLDPAKRSKPYRPDVVRSQALLSVPESERYLTSIQRRYSVAPLASANGLIVCATNAGGLYAVKADTLEPVWKHVYREPSEEKPKLVPLPTPAWKATALHVVDDHVILAAIDDSHVHCVALKDGTPRWTAERGEEFLLAGVTADRALLIGPKGCRALNLKDGKEAWRLTVGVPSGRGAFDGGLYFQPVKLGVKSQRPEIVALDVAAGKIVGRWLIESAAPPGNLILHRGRLISQSVLTVALFPPLAVPK